MKHLLSIMAALMIGISSYAQTVQLKKGIVYVDEKETLKYEGSEMVGFTISDLNGEQLFFLSLRPRYDGNYWKLVFIKQKTSMSYRTPFINRKSLIERMIKDGAIAGGKLIDEKVENFIAKYDQRLD